MWPKTHACGSVRVHQITRNSGNRGVHSIVVVSSYLLQQLCMFIMDRNEVSVAAENARAARRVYPMASFLGVEVIASRLLERLLSEGRCVCPTV